MHKTIDVDTSDNHPTITFLQDRETRDTIALDRATGEVVGRHGNCRPPFDLHNAVAAYRAQRRRDADV